MKQKGIRVYPNKWMYLNFLKNHQKKIRYGWTISKNVGPSVVRNKLKRWCRQYFREKALDFSDLCVDVNIILRPYGKIFYKKIKYCEFIKSLEKGLKLIRKLRKVYNA